MSRPRVLVTRRLPDEVERALAARWDATLNPDDRPLDAGELRDALATHDALLVTVTDRLTREVLLTGPADARRARIVASFGVGVNHVDLAAAREAGLVITNTPDVLTEDTADVALALMLMAARGLGAGERLVRAGRWDGWGPTRLLGTSLAGKTLGVVGFGRIGQATARRAVHGLGMRCVYWGPRATDDAGRALGATRMPTLEALLAASDVVSLHCPATPATRHLVDAAALARMRPTAILVNTARGDVVDEAALAAALSSGTIAAAGLDVFEAEPRVHPALLAMENVVLLPHLGSATRETRVAMGLRAVANLEAWREGREPPDRVA